MPRSTVCLTLLLLTACGPTLDTQGTGGGAGGGGSCCLNGSFYACGTKAAFDLCSGFDVGACMSACAPNDFNCPMACSNRASSASHDPSACTRTASRDGECGGGGGGSCVGTRGVACTYSTQCASGNCTNGYCYETANGNPCTYSTQCASGNCTNNCCSGNSAGDACTYSTQCNGGNCTNGVCQ